MKKLYLCDFTSNNIYFFVKMRYHKYKHPTFHGGSILKYELLNYDIFPKVFRAGETGKITIKPLGRHSAFEEGTMYHIRVMPMSAGAFYVYKERENVFDFNMSPNKRGELNFSFKFPEEGEYSVRVLNGDKKLIVKLAVYAVEADLCGRLPYIGDLHMHTCLSDGKESPEVVASNYRSYGYDFMAITDHRKYYPSLELIEKFKDVPLDMKIYPGEEIHTPNTDVHIVNFGGDYSINALYEKSQQNAYGTEESKRSVPGAQYVPPILTEEEYNEACDKAAEKFDIPDGIEKRSFGACVWIFDEIKKAGGLGIFCHPYWISDVYQVPENFTEYMLTVHPFDAFEVLGGESYYRQNGFQTAIYYEMRAKGIDLPIVGSTDTHGSTEANPNRLVASTIVFAPENSRDAIVSSIKEGYSVAVDGIPAEPRYVGHFRLIKYACFLMENYFPIHNKACETEGALMLEYVKGDTKAAKMLAMCAGNVPKMRKKYFAF